LQGSRDIPIDIISKENLNTILKNKKKLSELTFDKIFCSSLMRTHETAIIHGYQNFNIDKRLDELNFGKYEVRPKVEMQTDVMQLWKNNPKELVLGEPISDFFNRIDDFIENVEAQKILIFSHGAVMRYLKSKYILNNSSLMNQISIANGEILELSIKS